MDPFDLDVLRRLADRDDADTVPLATLVIAVGLGADPAAAADWGRFNEVYAGGEDARRSLRAHLQATRSQFDKATARLQVEHAERLLGMPSDCDPY